MNRQAALNTLWKRLFVILGLLLAVSVVIATYNNGYTVPLIVFITGNIDGYVGFHRRLGSLSDVEIQNLSHSWFAVTLPSLIGGVLAGLLYILFISGIVDGDLFPQINPDDNCNPENLQTFMAIFCQHAEDHAAYAKLLFWSFVAGFNQDYVVDLIETMKDKSDSSPAQ